jgi:hypothetical protein
MGNDIRMVACPGGWKRDRNSAHKLMTQGAIACGDLPRLACSCPNRADPLHSIFRASWERRRIGVAAILAGSRQCRSSHFNRDEYAWCTAKECARMTWTETQVMNVEGAGYGGRLSLKTPVDLTANGGGEDPVGLRKVPTALVTFFWRSLCGKKKPSSAIGYRRPSRRATETVQSLSRLQ